MARKRMLDSEIWRDKKVVRLSNEAFILWIAIISMSDDEGIFEYDADAWFYEIARKGLTVTKIQAAMQEIIAQNMVVMYGDGYGFIPAWYKHQTLSHPTPSKKKRPTKEILDRYPEYVSSWVKTFTTYKKNENNERVAVVPEYPYPETNNIIPENSGNIQKTPGSIDKVSIDKVSIVQSSIVQSSLVERSIQEYAPATPSPATQVKRFTKPTLADVQAYCAERGNSVDAQKFVDYYESNGWRVGKNAMKDWRAAVRTWERNNQQVNLKVLTKPMLDMEEV